jgi:hypothetical protein
MVGAHRNSHGQNANARTKAAVTRGKPSRVASVGGSREGGASRRAAGRFAEEVPAQPAV